MMWGTKSYVQLTLRSHISVRVALTLIHDTMQLAKMYVQLFHEQSCSFVPKRCRSEDSVSRDRRADVVITQPKYGTTFLSESSKHSSSRNRCCINGNGLDLHKPCPVSESSSNLHRARAGPRWSSALLGCKCFVCKSILTIEKPGAKARKTVSYARSRKAHVYAVVGEIDKRVRESTCLRKK